MQWLRNDHAPESLHYRLLLRGVGCPRRIDSFGHILGGLSVCGHTARTHSATTRSVKQKSIHQNNRKNKKICMYWIFLLHSHVEFRISYLFPNTFESVIYYRWNVIIKINTAVFTWEYQVIIIIIKMHFCCSSPPLISLMRTNNHAKCRANAVTTLHP